MQDQKPIGKWISVLGRYHQMQMGRLLEPMGIGLGQYPLLLDICRNPGMRQDYLSGRQFLNKSSVARGVAQLERNGYLERRVDLQDKRAYRLYPTPKAFEAREAVIGHSITISEQIMEGFSEEEKELLHLLMKRAVTNIAPASSGEPAVFPSLCEEGTPNESEERYL